MAGKYHGKDFKLYINGYDLSAMVASVTPVQEIEVAPYAVADGVVGYHQMRGLAKDALSIDGLFDDNYQTQLDSLVTATTGYRVVIPLGTALGDRALGCNEVKLTKYDWKAVVTDINRLTADLLAEDLPWDECKIIFPKAQKTSDGNHTGIDDGSASSAGLIAYLQVFECGADDTLIVKIQSDDNAGFITPTDLITFTTANGITTERKTVSGAVERYLRVSWAGTPAYQVTFAVVYKRG